MAVTLKSGMSAEAVESQDAKVRSIVEDILKSIGERGDSALREYSEQFDKWSPDRLHQDCTSSGT